VFGEVGAEVAAFDLLVDGGCGELADGGLARAEEEAEGVGEQLAAGEGHCEGFGGRGTS